MEKLFILLLGLGVGGCTAYLVTRRHYKLKAEADLKNDINREVNKQSERKTKTKDVENMSFEDGVDYAFDFLHMICRDDDEEIETLVNRLQKLGVGISYGEDYEESESVNPVYDEDGNPTDSDEDDSIYQIDQKEYCEGNLDFSKEQIDFYEGDSTFVDLESGEVIEKWKQYFGPDILNWIEDHNWRKETLYVRNMSLSSDYQIILKETSYSAANGESDDEDEYAPGDFADRRH